MPSENSNDLANDYCRTAYAAKILGMSVGSIQVLVEKNELKAWKTPGGHRRISMLSINEYLIKQNLKGFFVGSRDKCLRVLIVEDDAITCDLFRKYFENAEFPVDYTIMSSGMEALIDISNIKPDLLIIDLDIPGLDGFKFLRTLRQNPNFHRMIILVLSALTAKEVKCQGDLVKDSFFATKPVQAQWFDGFLGGIIVGRFENLLTHLSN